MNAQTQFAVVLNREAQHSIWPTEATLPAGWTLAGFTGSKSECAAYIQRTWCDIRPRSVRTPHPFGAPSRADSSWLPGWCPAPASDRGAVVFCFPYAAGGAHSYLTWSQRSNLHLLPLAYPGRGERCDEAFVEDMDALAAEIADFVTGYAEHHDLDSFAFFGHSMGALVAFATARELQKSQRPTPSLLTVSASPAPHLPIVNPLGQLDDERLLDAIEQLQDPQVRSHDRHQLRSVFLPILRNDLLLCERYRPSAAERVACPIIAVAADDDPRVEAARVEAWAELTTEHFDFHTIHGAHFYFERDCSAINTILEDALRPPAGPGRPGR